MHFWKFKNEGCLDEYATDSGWKNNTQEEWSINKIKTNFYGDQIAVSDIEGSLYIFSMGQNKLLPEITLKHMSYKETLDFNFLNQGSVICTVGYKPSPHLIVHDTLIPTGRSAVINEKIGGSIVLCYHDLKQLFIFSSKEKGMKIYDMRMQRLQGHLVTFCIIL